MTEPRLAHSSTLSGETESSPDSSVRWLMIFCPFFSVYVPGSLSTRATLLSHLDLLGLGGISQSPKQTSVISAFLGSFPPRSPATPGLLIPTQLFSGSRINSATSPLSLKGGHDIVIYRKKCAFGSPPISGLESLKPLEFLSDESDKGVFCYFNDVTFGQHRRIGAGCQNTPQ